MRGRIVAGGVGCALGVLASFGLSRTSIVRVSADCQQGIDGGATEVAASSGNEAWLQANANLAETVREYKNRLATNQAERATIEARLKQAETKLAIAENDGAALRSEFDLTKEDWIELAKDGIVKARYPCNDSKSWEPKPDRLTELGLAPQDGPAVSRALAETWQRAWEVVRPLCEQAIGNKELVEKLSLSGCTSLIRKLGSDDDGKIVSETKAGLRPMPDPNDLSPRARMMFAQTNAMKTFEDALSPAIGPADAHRVAYDDALGMCSGTYGDRKK